MELLTNSLGVDLLCNQLGGRGEIGCYSATDGNEGEAIRGEGEERDSKEEDKGEEGVEED